MKVTDAYLMHHGIKGMHWGIRRFQNEDGSLTPAGKKRYYTNIAQKEYNERTMNAIMHPFSTKASAKLSNTGRSLLLAKDRDKILNEDPSKKNKKREQYEKEYLEKGYSKEDAELAAMYKDRTKKLLAVAGGMALAGAAYAGYKYLDNNADHFISDKTKMFRVDTNDELNDGFYATTSKLDALKYKGIFPTEKIAKGQAPANANWHQKVMSAASGGITVAGDKAGKKALSSVLSSGNESAKSDLRNALSRAQNDSLLSASFKQAAVITKGIDDFEKGKYNSSFLYKAANISIPYCDRANKNSFRNTYFNELKKNGYGAISDVNDRSYSAYKARRSTLIFDADSVKIDESKKLGKKAIKSSLFAGVMASSAATIAAQQVGANLGATRQKSKQAKRIAEYRKEHPNTKMTDSEILDKVYKVDRYK